MVELQEPLSLSLHIFQFQNCLITSSSSVSFWLIASTNACNLTKRKNRFRDWLTTAAAGNVATVKFKSSEVIHDSLLLKRRMPWKSSSCYLLLFALFFRIFPAHCLSCIFLETSFYEKYMPNIFWMQKSNFFWHHFHLIMLQVNKIIMTMIIGTKQ